MSHDQLFKAAKDAIDRLFNDTSVPASTTLASLQTLIDEIEVKRQALEHDIAQKEQ